MTTDDDDDDDDGERPHLPVEIPRGGDELSGLWGIRSGC